MAKHGCGKPHPKPLETASRELKPLPERSFRRYGRKEWSGLKTARFYLKVADRFLRLGDAFTAYDIVRHGLGEHLADPRQIHSSRRENPSLLQLKALALARSGAVERARRVLHRTKLDETGLGILARLVGPGPR